MRAKPDLREQIISLLLNIDKLNRCRHPELLKSYVIEAFDDCFEMIPAEERAQIIELNWLAKDTTRSAQQAQPQEMRYYVIREGEQWKLINPIDVLTRDWQSHETGYFIFHYPKETNIQDHLAELKLMDDECEKALKVFGIDLPQKIHFYKARTQTECGELLMHPSSNGYAAVGFVSRQKDTPDSPGFRIVVSISFINPHEVVHLLTALAGIPFVNAAIVEGIASALGGNTQTTADFTLAEAKNLLDHPMHFPLQKLLTLSDADFLRNNFITYYEAGAFIKFLIDTFGIQKLKELCIETQSAEGFVQTIPNVYGYSIDELEEQLQSYLAQRNTPDVAFTIPPEAELVFSMSDPAGDDTGDGDYTYPRHKSFKKGVFDLQKFEVLKDSSRAYFRLLFQNMIQPVSYGASTEKFAPGVVIAIKKAGSDGRHVQRFCHGVQFEEGEGYDVKLNI
ncbi:MAG: glucodextranase DOMON-like domain-containing protein, partial [bacterium]